MFRNPKQMGRWIAIAVAIGLFCSSQALAKKPPKPPADDPAAPYTLVDLLGIPGGSFLQSDAHAVSGLDAEGGVFVAGNSHTAGEVHPVLWAVDGDGSFTEPLDLGGPANTNRVDVNDAGIVITASAHVFVPGRPMQELPRVGAVRTTASAVNNLGQIVGTNAFDNGEEYQWFGALWELDEHGLPGNPISLGDFFPTDISDTGVMAGESLGLAAIAWFDAQDDLRVEFLGVLEGHDWSHTEAISTNGVWVAGTCDIADGGEAFLWSESTGMIGLGSFGRTSKARGVNNAGQVVGICDTNYGGRYSQAAFLWDGQMFDLNALVDTGGKIHLQLAKDINDAGHIVGLLHISRPVSESHGFLLIPNGE